ncbi:hypothetical protein LINGRAHAP2_LOCUS6769 [Linum grandiflorum]
MTDLDVEAMARELRSLALLADNSDIAISENLTDAQAEDLNFLAPGDDLTHIPLHEVDFWILVYGLTAEFYSEVVGKALGNFLGSFILYDDTNKYVDCDSYMRIRVNLDFPRNAMLPLLWDASLRAPTRRDFREIPSPWLISTLAERRVAILCSGGTAKGTLVQGRHQRPTNIQALVSNFRTGLTQGDRSATMKVPAEPEDDQPL